MAKSTKGRCGRAVVRCVHGSVGLHGARRPWPQPATSQSSPCRPCRLAMPHLQQLLLSVSLLQPAPAGAHGAASKVYTTQQAAHSSVPPGCAQVRMPRPPSLVVTALLLSSSPPAVACWRRARLPTSGPQMPPQADASAAATALSAPRQAQLAALLRRCRTEQGGGGGGVWVWGILDFFGALGAGGGACAGLERRLTSCVAAPLGRVGRGGGGGEESERRFGEYGADWSRSSGGDGAVATPERRSRADGARARACVQRGCRATVRTSSVSQVLRARAVRVPICVRVRAQGSAPRSSSAVTSRAGILC